MSDLATDAEMWDRRYSAPDLVWGTEPNRRLVAEVSALPPGRALDLGAGEGRNAAWLATRGWDVTAVDFSPAGTLRAREMAARQGVLVNALVADLAEYVPDPGAFDLVIILYLQVPPDLLDRVVGRAADALAPGGTLLLIGHAVRNLEHGHGGPQDISLLHSPEQVVRAIGDPLIVDIADHVERIVATAGGERVAIDTLVRAHRPQRTAG